MAGPLGDIMIVCGTLLYSKPPTAHNAQIGRPFRRLVAFHSRATGVCFNRSRAWGPSLFTELARFHIHWYKVGITWLSFLVASKNPPSESRCGSSLMSRYAHIHGWILGEGLPLFETWKRGELGVRLQRLRELRYSKDCGYRVDKEFFSDRTLFSLVP